MVAGGVKTLQGSSAVCKIRITGEATQWGEMKEVCVGGSVHTLQWAFDEGSHQPSLSETIASFMETP
jgi:hypothetical protein